MDTDERMEHVGRRQHEVSSPQLFLLEGEETESDEDLLMTYSSDENISPRQLQTTNSIPLMQFDSVDEDELPLIDLPVENNSEDEPVQPTPTSVLMLPSLSTSPYSHDITVSNSDGFMVPFALDEIKKEALDVGSSPMSQCPSTASLDSRPRPTFFKFQEATLEQVTIVRTTSSPTKSTLKRQAASPLGNQTPRKAPSPLKRSLENAYSLRKQVSLPLASRGGAPFLLSPDGNSRSSSPSTITHHEMAELARDFSTARKHDDSKIFRQILRQSPKGRPREIPHVNTGRTDKSDEELGGLEWTATTDEISDVSTRRHHANFSPTEIEAAQGSLNSTSTDENAPLLVRKSFQYVYYLSTYACFGTIIRAFLGRLFGYDCESKSINDWLSPLSNQICVTASGTTAQTGGALFIALPANVIGSFLLGVLTVLEPSVWPPIPWLNADHPLQQNHALHVAIKIGMCGSLTTFSSWNSQMIIMMDGSQTVLGPQIASALCGYLLGTMAAVGSFLVGTHVSAWLNDWRNPVQGGSGRHEEEPPRTIHHPRLCARLNMTCEFLHVLCFGRNVGIVLLIVLMTLFFVGDMVFNSIFYRSLWMSILLTPPGALLRWSLAARWNGVALRPGWGWLPLGTLAANVVGSFISIWLLAFQFRYFKDAGSSWAALILSALVDGFAGSLTSVSTLVKELCEISNRFPHHAKPYYYCGITIGPAILISLIVYMPIVRSN